MGLISAGEGDFILPWVSDIILVSCTLKRLLVQCGAVGYALPMGLSQIRMK
jgi:hypothetical protein